MTKALIISGPGRFDPKTNGKNFLKTNFRNVFPIEGYLYLQVHCPVQRTRESEQQSCVKKTAYRNCSHLKYWTLEGELLKAVLLGSQHDQRLGQYSCLSFTVDKLYEWVPSVCYPDLRSLITKKISLLIGGLDSKREQETSASPRFLAEPCIAQTSLGTALRKGQAC